MQRYVLLNFEATVQDNALQVEIKKRPVKVWNSKAITRGRETWPKAKMAASDKDETHEHHDPYT